MWRAAINSWRILMTFMTHHQQHSARTSVLTQDFQLLQVVDEYAPGWLVNSDREEDILNTGEILVCWNSLQMDIALSEQVEQYETERVFLSSLM